MLFDVHIENMIKSGEMSINDRNGKVLTLDFLKRYDMIQPASLDIRLNTAFAVHRLNIGLFKSCTNGKCFDTLPISSAPVDPMKIQESDYEIIEVGLGQDFVVPPLSFCLAGTMESVVAPSSVCYQLDGKSTIGRLGLSTHITAGFADPGFKNQITLEIFNHNFFPIILRPGMFIGQYKFFMSCDGVDASAPYSSKGTYVGQPATQPPKVKKLFRFLVNEGYVKSDPS